MTRRERAVGSVRTLTRSPLAATGCAVLLVGAGLLGLRGAGALEVMDLAAYDWYLRLRSFEPAPDARITLVAVSESDIRAQGRWPLSDDTLAEALEALVRYRPRVIGLDIYRDVPVPPGGGRLEAVLRDNRHVIGVMKFGGGSSHGVPAPAGLRGSDRVGFNDILVDPGGTVRRGLLFLDDGTATATAFALRLALVYLQAEGVTARPDAGDPAHLRLGRATIRPLEANDGGYVRADARGYQFLLDFKGGGRPFASLSLAALLSRTVAPETVRDKVVLIGVTGESVKDNFYTPLSRGLLAEQQVPGIAIHAHAVSQLLRIGLEGAAPMATPKRWQDGIWILLWSAAGGMLGLGVRSPWGFSLAAAAGLGGLGLVDLLAFVEGWWLPLVPPAMGWLTSAALVTAYMSHRETVQRAVLMQLFSRNVSPEVAEAIWQQRDQFLDGGRPRSQRLTATVLFTDLTGFTTVSERLSPEALMHWLNEYMEAMAQRVSDHGGVIRQYAGDSIVVMFGVPVARRTDGEIARDALRAVDCALAMGATLGKLNRRWQAEGLPVTGMRIGIFTGPVVAGTLGSAQRSEYVVLGDTVNTASRLESFDKTLFPPDPATTPCRILVGDTTARYLGDRFELQRVGDVSLKGKVQAVGIYRVLGRAAAPPASPGKGGGA